MLKRIAHNFGLNSMNSLKVRKYFCLQEEKAESNLQLVTKKVPPSLIKEGQVIDKVTQSVYGDHDGVINHYIGENELKFSEPFHIRREFEIVDYDHTKGEIYVGAPSTLTFRGVQIKELVLVDTIDRSRPITCFIKFKHHKRFMKCNIFFKNNKSAYVDFFDDVYPLVQGEHVAIYDRDTRNAKVIGHGVVDRRGEFKLLDRVEKYRVEEKDENENEEQEKSIQPSFKDQLFRF
jgi:tRNA U34 2-thiouridine synthase MnmA/TrmU